MKTTTVARGFIGAVASLLGVVAVGCSADVMDQGAAGEGEIGSVEQALTTVASVRSLADAVSSAGGAITDPVARHLSASCKVTISNVDYMVVYGGYDNAGNALDELFIYKPTATDSWTKLASLADQSFSNQARGNAQFLKLDADSCLLVGGLSAREGGVVRAKTFKLDVTAANAATWTDAGDLAAGRAHFGLAKCGNQTGTNTVMVIGGSGAGATENMGALITGANAVEVWDGTNDWDSIGLNGGNNVMNPHVAGFAFADKSDHLKFVVASGYNGSAVVSSLQTFTTNNDCTALTRLTTTNLLADDDSTPQGRLGAVAKIQPGTNDLIVVGGDDGSTLPTHAEIFDISTNPPTRGTKLTGLTGVRFPTPAYDDTAKFVAIGGELIDSRNAPDVLISEPIQAAQEFNYSSGWAVGTPVNLGTARSGATVEFLNSESKFYVNSGLTAEGTGSSPEAVTVTAITQSVQ